MRETVRDDEGNRYILLKRSAESSLVRDPSSGEELYLSNDSFETVEEPTLGTALDGIPDEVVTVCTAVHDDRALALLLELEAAESMAVRTLLDAYDLCESDLHGIFAELRAAGLVTETRVAGERGYEVTEKARRAVASLRDDE